ncbi:MAG: hypothetical protein MMC23_000512 [Stictis urceolatum]|nr:hypothetical protein [Stictis urceolata]
MPQLGFKHDFLLKGILTLGALHLSHLVPARQSEFRLKASSLQQEALTSFQATLPNLSESNCQALFCFALLLIPIAFAMRLTDETSNVSELDAIDWVWLIRGGLSILRTHEDNFRNSFLYPFLDYANNTEAATSHDHPYAADIAVLFEVARGMEDGEASRACILATHSLLTTFIQATQLQERHEGTMLQALAWPAHQSEKFMELLSQRNPQALIIVAHYCVLIHIGSQDEDSWFLIGCAERMLSSIKASLPEPYHNLLEWPERTILGAP